MDSNDCPELAERVVAALYTFADILANPKEITPRLIHGWVTALSAAGVTPGQVEPTITRLLQTQRFFPTPADFLEAVEVPDKPMASAIPPWADESTKSDPKYLSVHEKFLRATGGSEKSS